MAINPTLAKLIKSFIKYELDDVNVAIPGRVLEYNNEFQKATVQPIVKERYRDDQTAEEDKDEFGIVQADMPVMIGVPVIFPSFNNGIVSAPLRKGDLVQLLFNHRSLDLWLHSEDEKFNPKTINPEDNRMHDYSDAVAIPGIYPFKRALGSHPEYFQIRYNVETGAEISMSFTQQGDLIFDVPGKVKWNCNNWEMFNLGGIREQHAGGIVSRVDGDIREDWNGKYERHHAGTTVDRRTGAITFDYLDSLSIAAETDIIVQSRDGNLNTNVSKDILLESDNINLSATTDILVQAGGNINDDAGGDHITNGGGKVDMKSGSTMTFEHGGNLELDGSGVGSAPTAPTSPSIPSEGAGTDLVFAPTTLNFVETHNSSFQYESKFFIVDNPTEGAQGWQFRIFGIPDWITLSRPLREGRDSTAPLGVNGFGQDIIVVDLNQNTKNLAVGTYQELIIIEEVEELPNNFKGTEIGRITVNLEIRP